MRSPCHAAVTAARRDCHPPRLRSWSMRGAVIDLGSNTFHTLVAEVDRFGIVQALHDEKVAVRLGAEAFATGRIPAPPLTPAPAAASVLIDNARTHTPDILRIVATGVFREAVNGRALLADIEER